MDRQRMTNLELYKKALDAMRPGYQPPSNLSESDKNSILTLARSMRYPSIHETYLDLIRRMETEGVSNLSELSSNVSQVSSREERAARAAEVREAIGRFGGYKRKSKRNRKSKRKSRKYF